MFKQTPNPIPNRNGDILTAIKILNTEPSGATGPTGPTGATGATGPLELQVQRGLLALLAPQLQAILFQRQKAGLTLSEILLSIIGVLLHLL